MTTDRAPRLVTIKSSGTAVLLHPCSVCGGDASFGSGVALLKDRLGTWYCAAHRPAPARANIPAPTAKAGQGSLL